MLQKEQEEKLSVEVTPKPSQESPDCQETLLDLTGYNILAIIPAYNEERFIGSVVLKTCRCCDHVIVVDDGSSDATAEIAAIAGAFVIRHDENQGKGVALNTGIQHACTLNPDAVVLLDADGQHSPKELGLVVSPVIQDEADIVVGSRYLENNGGTPRHRVWGHWFFNWLTRLGSGTPSSDSQSGFRALSPRALDVITFSSKGFSVESEMQFVAKQHHLRLLEVPITIQYLDKPKRNVMSHGMRVLNGVLRLVGQYRPLLFFGLPGLVVLLAGMIMGGVVVDIYNRSQELAVGYAMISIMLAIIGSLGLITGIILHSIRGLLIDMGLSMGRK